MLYTYIVYNSILFFTVFFSYCVEKSPNKVSERLSRLLLFISQALPACIREGIGTDYWNYVGLYKLYQVDNDDHEVGFQFLADVLIFFDAHYQWFIIALTVLALAPICFYVPKKHFSYFSITYFLLLYLDIIGSSRQDVSVGLIVCGICFLYQKKGSLKYLVCAALAFLMHYSSALYFSLVLLKKIKISAIPLYIILGVTLIVTSGASLFEMISQNEMFMDSPYGVYVGSQYDREANVGSGLGIIANLLIAIIFIILYPRSSKHINNPGFFAILGILFIGSYILASQIHIFGRLLNIFIFVPAFLAYPTCKAIWSKFPRFIFCGFVFLYLVLFEKTIAISLSTLGNGLGITPYQTIFD